MQIYGKLGAAWDRNASLHWSHQSKLMDMSKNINLKVKNASGIVEELNMGTFLHVDTTVKYIPFMSYKTDLFH